MAGDSVGDVGAANCERRDQRDTHSEGATIHGGPAQRLNCVIELLSRSAIDARCWLEDATAVIEAVCC